jgi:ABC-type multidrug transport system fused ATPase/permease subunit
MNASQLSGNVMQNIAQTATEATTSIANTAIKAANSFTDVAADATSTVAQALNAGVNSAFKSVNSAAAPVMNSFNSFNNHKNNAGKHNNANHKNNSANANSSFSALNSTTTIASAASGWFMPLGVFLLLVSIFLMLFVFYKKEFTAAYNNIAQSIRNFFKKPSTPVPPTSDGQDALHPPESPSDTANNVASNGILDKIMPMSKKEVFNVSANDYTSYDAEPLCRALGAELATYDQVKAAWEKGADWCNYGWVKGQVAVYPTQKETWDKLQHGPEDEKYACGEPGVNGGAFDNPEMRFGVNCYGKKPEQSAADERILMERGTIPKTPDTLKVDQQIKKFKEQIDTLGILPFNGNAWTG